LKNCAEHHIPEQRIIFITATVNRIPVEQNRFAVALNTSYLT